MKTWYATVKGHEIRIENTLSNVMLYIDGNVADVSGGVASAKLQGQLSSGEAVIAAMGQGITGVKCKLVVGNSEVPLTRKYKL